MYAVLQHIAFDLFADIQPCQAALHRIARVLPIARPGAAQPACDPSRGGCGSQEVEGRGAGVTARRRPVMLLELGDARSRPLQHPLQLLQLAWDVNRCDKEGCDTER